MQKTISEKLEDIHHTLKTDHLLYEADDEKLVRDYYIENKLAYRLFHNWKGYLHMGISRDGVYKKEDLLEQVREVARYIDKKKTKRVLELGAGRGANSFYLAKQFPEVVFDAVDLSTTSLYRRNNLQFHQADYHNLSLFPDETFDVIFAIETICHSSRKEVVLDQIYKKLKQGGVCIIYDGYLGTQKEILTEEQTLAVKLMAKGMVVGEWTPVDSFDAKIAETQFSVAEREDLSEYILPTLYKFERRAKTFFKYKVARKILDLIFSEKVIRNSLAAYLLPNLIEQRIVVYVKHVLKK